MKRFLAIDQSTSATKAALFDATGRLLDKCARDHRQIYPQAGWVEHDAEEIWQNTLAVLKELTARQPGEAGVLSITNQRETVVVFERGTGRPLWHALVWQDRRGEAICREMEPHADAVEAKTGLKLDTYFSGSKLKWLLRERPEIARKLREGDALIGTIDAYLVYRLTEGRVFATDTTNASRTLLFDIDRLAWDEELCSLFDVPVWALPEVREPFANYGQTVANGIFAEPVAVCGVMGDSQASFFAQRCYSPGMAKATFGTGTSLLLNVGPARPESRGGAVTALGWVRERRPVYALEGIINYSAATLAWLKDRLGLIKDAAEVEALATAVPDNGGVYLVPAFSGLSAPYWNPSARAAISGLTAFSKREHVVRAGLESIAYQVRDVLDMMSRETGVNPRAVHADGGPTRNAFLMQFTADIAGVELRAADIPESSALGAALAGMLGTGTYRSLEDLAALPRELRTYRPQMAREQAHRLHQGWSAAVQRVL